MRRNHKSVGYHISYSVIPPSCPLAVSGHDDASLRLDSVLRSPEARHGLLLGIKVQTGLTIEGVGTTTGNTLLITGEGEHGQWHWDGHIDTNLTGLEILLESGRSGARSSEDGGTIAILVGVDQVDGVVKSLHLQTDEYRTEDLFLVASHVWLDTCDDSWAHLTYMLVSL